MNTSKWLSRLTKYSGVLFIIIAAFFAILAGSDERLFQVKNQKFRWIQSLATIPVTVEEQWFDWRDRMLNRDAPVDPDVVVLAIDDISLSKIGRFPWTRTVWEKVLSRLAEFDAKVVTFDVLFSEPERYCTGTSPDQIFARAIEKFQQNGRSVVLGYGFTGDPELQLKELPPALQMSAVSGQVKSPYISDISYINFTTIPTPIILDVFPKVAHISAVTSADGVFRRSPLLLPVQQNTTGAPAYDAMPSLALATIMAWQEGKPDAKQFSYFADGDSRTFHLRIQNPTSEAKTDEKVVELGLSGETRIRFRGGTDKYPTLSIAALLEAKPNDPEFFKALSGKAVFVGSTAYAAHDLRHTPVDSALPGVYIHANVFSALRDQLFVKPAADSFAASMLLFFGSLTILLAVLSTPSPLFHFFAMASLLAAISLIDFFFYLPHGYQIAVAFISMSLFFTYSWITLFNFIASVRERRQIRSTFQRYVAPAIVKQMLSHPELLRVGGQKRNVSMMFSDVRDFTSISEKLTPQDLALLLNRYMGRMTDILFDSQGTLDKYIGDAIVGFWGAPVDVTGHPKLAVSGALRMVETLPEINAQFRDSGLPQISIGIGLNTGEVAVGNMGSDRIFQYTALGDHMNLASRLEGLTKNYGISLLVSEYTLDSLGEAAQEFVMRPIDKVRVKGKEKAVAIFEPIHSYHPLKARAGAIEEFQSAFAAYQERRFREALASFAALAQEFPTDRPTQIHVENCRHYLDNPPDDNWDGATTFKTK